MATFKGTEKDFNLFIGPLTRNIVCNLARKHKKHTTCQYEKGCNKRTGLEAAHIKGKERPVIIASLLAEVDLKEFEEKFKAAHNPIEETILPLCKKHHIEYDKKEGITEEYPIFIDVFVDEQGNKVYSEEELESLEKSESDSLEEAFKIGKKARSIFNDLESDNNLSFEQLDLLCREGYSKEIFDMNFPVLKEYYGDKDIANINNYPRYYTTKIYTFNGKKYILSNDWYERNREKLETWYKSISI